MCDKMSNEMVITECCAVATDGCGTDELERSKLYARWKFLFIQKSITEPH